MLIDMVMNDKSIQYVCIMTLTTVLAFSLCFGYFSGFVLTVAFIAGVFTFQYIIRYKSEIENILSILNEDGGKNPTIKVGMSFTCKICGDSKCDREEIVHQKSRSGPMVPVKIDQAVSDLLQKTFKEFITLWSQDIAPDLSFQQELREAVKNAATSVLSRVIEIDFGKLLSTKGLRVLMKHTFNLRLVGTSQQKTFHPAIISRKAELSYLRTLSSKLLPYLLTEQNLNCKTFEVLLREILCGWIFLPFSDAVCDPVVINSILVVLMDQDTLTNINPAHQEDQVEFLANFVAESKSHLRASTLKPDMCTILKDQSLLFAYMQFLKTQGNVNILQFCLDVEEFNRRMLIPDLSSEDLDLLYRDAWDLFSVYFSPHSPDTLNFPIQLVRQMRKVLSKDVTKLRTSPPLFQAYEHAYNLLDSTYCPTFHTSNEFYTWLCGPKGDCCQSKSGSSSPSLSGSPAKYRYEMKSADSIRAVSRLSSSLQKLTGALKVGSVTEGQSYHMDISGLDIETDTDFVEALQFESERDLSKWRITIPDNNSIADPYLPKVPNMITINIERFDVPEGHLSQWKVQRRFADFYSLDAKLTEFHGEFPDIQLPPKRNIGNGSSSFGCLDSLQLYEDYLKKLVSHPALRGSDLLFSFLTNFGEFASEDNTFGRLMRRGVPITLRKEKGQHLESFISYFISSSESKLHYSKLEYQDISQESLPENTRNVITPVFGNNLGLELSSIILPYASGKCNEIPISPSHYLIYFGLNVLHWSKSTIQLVIAVQKLFGNTLDVLFQYWLNYKLNRLIGPPRIAHLVHLLKRIIYDPKSDADRSKVAKTVERLITERNGWKRYVYETLYLAGQSPLFNKQLFYCLLDQLIEELFPEINSKK